MYYGSPEDKWVGTKNLTKGIDVIRVETDMIYASY